MVISMACKGSDDGSLVQTLIAGARKWTAVRGSRLAVLLSHGGVALEQQVKGPLQVDQRDAAVFLTADLPLGLSGEAP
jgi:hypothetical protein